MVVRIKTGKSIRGALNYNEKKVQQGSAELLLAYKFGGDVKNMGFSEKVVRLEKLTQLNDRSKTNTLHLSLNFSADDQIDTETMQKIALEYMERIGFGNQPFLAYRHNDAAHPHIHIVAPTIRSNGSPIYLHNIGKLQSEPARKIIEHSYELVKAEGRKQSQVDLMAGSALKAVQYGDSYTKRAISNIVTQVAATYNFSSFDEYNAILALYNVKADHGYVGSRMHQNKGLIYSILDGNGFKVGVPIKASAIYGSPTLKNIEKRFAQNAVRKAGRLNSVKNEVREMLRQSQSISAMTKKLEARGLICKMPPDEAQKLFNGYLIDAKAKVVFTLKELGIPSKLLDTGSLITNNEVHISRPITKVLGDNSESSKNNYSSFDLIAALLTVEANKEEVTPEALKRKRKKKRV